MQGSLVKRQGAAAQLIGHLQHLQSAPCVAPQAYRGALVPELLALLQNEAVYPNLQQNAAQLVRVGGWA